MTITVTSSHRRSHRSSLHRSSRGRSAALVGGGLAVFAVAVVALGAAFGFAAPRAASIDSSLSPDDGGTPFVSLVTVVIVAAADAAMITFGVLKLGRIIGDVRRERTAGIVRRARLAGEIAASPPAPLVDGLTSLPNRRRFETDLGQSLDAGAVGLVLVDIDHVLRFNQDHGREAGDVLIREIALLLSENVREGDVVYRCGGGRFGTLLGGADEAETEEIAERLRLAVEDHDFELGETQPGGRVTVSVGTVVATDAAPLQVQALADRALTMAKIEGRNRVAAADQGVVGR